MNVKGTMESKILIGKSADLLLRRRKRNFRRAVSIYQQSKNLTNKTPALGSASLITFRTVWLISRLRIVMKISLNNSLDRLYIRRCHYRLGRYQLVMPIAK